MQVLLRFILISVAVVILFGSCMAKTHIVSGENKNPHPTEERTMTSQLIIKFKDSKTDPTRVDFLKQLSSDANATLHYLRPMSGGAHVFRVVSFADEKQLAVIIQRLSKRADIEYVEKDSIMVHQ